MSLASILNDNDDINFPELICGSLTADTITARIINGGSGGGGGGNFSTPASEDLDMNNHAITDVNSIALLPPPNSSKKIFTLVNNSSKGLGFSLAGNIAMANIYDNTYNIPPGNGTFSVSGNITSSPLNFTNGSLVIGRSTVNMSISIDCKTPSGVDAYISASYNLTYKWDGTTMYTYIPSTDTIIGGSNQIFTDGFAIAGTPALLASNGLLGFEVTINGFTGSGNYASSYTLTTCPCA